MSADPTQIAAWNQQTRDLLGARKAAGARLESGNTEPLDWEDDNTAKLIADLSNFAVFQAQSEAFRARHAELLKQHEAAPPEPVRQRLGLALRQLRQEVQTLLAEAPRRNAIFRWPGELKALPKLKPGDGMIGVERILSEIARLRDPADPAWSAQLDAVEKHAKQMKPQILERARALKTETLQDCVRIRDEALQGTLAGGALLAVIDDLRLRVKELQAECRACGLEVSDIETAVDLKGLDRRYEDGFPKRNKEAVASPRTVTEGKAPTLDDEKTALELMTTPPVNKNWFTLKKLFKAGEISEEKMKQAWALRQKIVDDYMKSPVTEIYKLKENVTWIAPGSTNLESDIDVTILDHFWSEGSGEDRKINKTDADIVKEFNDWFMTKYGAQPGIMFDVNLYASAKPRRPLPPLEQQSPVEQAMTSMTHAGQDMGALMKMRRFMSWEEFDEYQSTVLEQMVEAGADGDDITTTLLQFETAEAKFQMAIRASLEKLVALLESREEHTEEQAHALELVRRVLSQVPEPATAEGQKMLLAAAREIEHMQDVAMWVNNELYTEGIAEVRELELEVDELKQQIEAGSLGPDSPEAVRMSGKVARLKQLATDTVFFANEAYHSEGPFAHIVEATQAVKGSLKAQLNREPTKEEIEKETKRRQDALSVHLCLQSFNEQAGDLLKDLGHYAGEDNPGIGFYRSSKYLVRLMDAMALLKTKGVEVEGPDPSAVSQAVKETLLAARKGEIQFAGIAEKDKSGEEQETQAYAIEQMERILGVRTLGALGTWVKKIGAQVNARARQAIANEMRAAKELERAFFSK